MARKKNRERRPDPESGVPGGGAGRRDEVEPSGVYPASAGFAPEDAVIRNQAGWGQGDRGAAGYEDSGQSELNITKEDLEMLEGKPTRQSGGASSGSGGSEKGARSSKSTRSSKRKS